MIGQTSIVTLASRLILFGALGLISFAGCSRSQESLIEVRGRVSFGGKPLATGVVSLRPDAERGNKSLHQPTGVIDPTGDYRIFTNQRPGAPPGWYRVVVFATEPTVDTGKAHPGMPKSLIPVRYNNPATSPLQLEVRADGAPGENDFSLESK